MGILGWFVAWSLPGVDSAVQDFALHIPRIPVEELEANVTLRNGHHAYVIKDYFLGRWKATNWTLPYLQKKIPFEWVDYYPESMPHIGNKPFLYKLEDAMPRFLEPSRSPRYMQLRVGLRGWQRLLKDFHPLPAPDVFWSDEEWIHKCMQTPDGKPDKMAIDNFLTTNQWKFLLIGEKGTSMFFHKDGTAASSWQAQVMGTKRWTLCPNSESHLLSTDLDTYNPDYNRFPRFAEANCGQVTASRGDLLYYPAYWWHHALQTETPTVSYTGALVGVEANRKDVGGNGKVHDAFFKDLKEKCAKCWQDGKQERICDDISLKWPGAAPPPLRVVCDSYLPKCLELWDVHARSLHEVPRQRSGSRGDVEL